VDSSTSEILTGSSVVNDSVFETLVLNTGIISHLIGDSIIAGTVSKGMTVENITIDNRISRFKEKKVSLRITVLKSKYIRLRQIVDFNK
jgi:hypothetical protein